MSNSLLIENIRSHLFNVLYTVSKIRMPMINTLIKLLRIQSTQCE